MAERKKKVYIFQVNYLYGNTAHLPYTAGALLSYAFADDTVKEIYRPEKIFFIREDPEKLLEQIIEPAVVGFSTYIWNFEFNKYMAARIREKYPDCTVIFGGHHVTPGGKLLEECPSVDYLIHGEGEEAFRRLLLAAAGLDRAAEIPGVSYREGAEIRTNPSVIPDNAEIDYPSPYLGGYFDDILKEYPDMIFMALIETTRGCPNSCSYCDWSNMKSRIRKFPLERVFGEIDWVSEHKIYGLGSADSNFGIFQRDELITDYIIRKFLNNGYPRGYQTSYAKNSNERIFRIGRALEHYHLSKGITLSFQSMDDRTLENIGRKNISVENYRELMDMYNAAGISTYTELILGLPGETYESFISGIEKLLELGQHNSIYIHNCEWLPCSVMGTPEYAEKYQIKTARIPLNQPHIEADLTDGIPEYSRLVISTCSMTETDWIRMNLYSFTVQCFHHLGLFQLFALYLYNEKNVGYGDFYNKTLAWLLTSDNAASRVMRGIRQRLTDIVNGVPGAGFVAADERFGKVRWPFEEYLFLCAVWEPDAFYDAAGEFLSEFFGDDPVFPELMRFQRAMIKRPFNKETEIITDYDFETYFLNALENRRVPLKKEKHTTEINAVYYDDWTFYAKKVVWFGRKENRNIYLGENGERSEDK